MLCDAGHVDSAGADDLAALGLAPKPPLGRRDCDAAGALLAFDDDLRLIGVEALGEGLLCDTGQELDVGIGLGVRDIDRHVADGLAELLVVGQFDS